MASQKTMIRKTFRPPTKDGSELSNVPKTAPTVNKKSENTSVKGYKKDKTKKAANKQFKEKKVYSYFPGLADDIKMNSKQNVNKQAPTPQTTAESLMLNNQLTISVVPTSQQNTPITLQNKPALLKTKQNSSLVPSGIQNTCSPSSGP